MKHAFVQENSSALKNTPECKDPIMENLVVPVED